MIKQIKTYLVITEPYINTMEAQLVLIPLALIIIGSLLFYLCISNESDTKNTENRECRTRRGATNKRKRKAKRARNGDIGGPRISQPSTSDSGSHTLISNGMQTSLRLRKMEIYLKANDVTSNLSTQEKMTEKQETVQFKNVLSSVAVQAVLDYYPEPTVRKAVNYLMKRESYRNDAVHLTFAIEHIVELEKRKDLDELLIDEHGLPPDYTPAELCEILQEKDTPDRIEQFKKHYGFLPTPQELMTFIDNDRDIMLKKEKKLKDQLDQSLQEIGKLQKQVRELKQQQYLDSLLPLCKICLRNEVNIVLRPCQHAALCVQCAKLLHGTPRGPYNRKECGICGVVVKSYSRIYLS